MNFQGWKRDIWFWYDTLIRRNGIWIFILWHNHKWAIYFVRPKMYEWKQSKCSDKSLTLLLIFKSTPSSELSTILILYGGDMCLSPNPPNKTALRGNFYEKTDILKVTLWLSKKYFWILTLNLSGNRFYKPTILVNQKQFWNSFFSSLWAINQDNTITYLSLQWILLSHTNSELIQSPSPQQKLPGSAAVKWKRRFLQVDPSSVQLLSTKYHCWIP